jgi:hypothetical protein
VSRQSSLAAAVDLVPVLGGADKAPSPRRAVKFESITTRILRLDAMGVSISPTFHKDRPTKYVWVKQDEDEEGGTLGPMRDTIEQALDDAEETFLPRSPKTTLSI